MLPGAEIKLNVPYWQMKYLRKLARRRGVSVGEVIRDIILQHKLDTDAMTAQETRHNANRPDRS